MVRGLLSLTLLAAAVSHTHAVKTRDTKVQVISTHAAQAEDNSALGYLRQLPMRMMSIAALLKKFQVSVETDKEEDAKAIEEMRTWCDTNKKSKGDAVLNGQADVNKLTASIEGNTAKSAGLKTAIAASISAYESDKESLAEVTALREKEVADFQQTQLDLTKYISQLDAAIITLSKYGSAALPQMPLSFLQAKNIDDEDDQWGMGSEASRSLDAIMESNGLTDSDDTPAPTKQPQRQFLQAEDAAKKAEAVATYHDFVPAAPVWSAADLATLKQGMHAATLFMQSKHEDTASLESPETSEILGILKQMKDEMTEDLARAKQTELEASESFEKLRKSKTEEIEGDLKAKEDQEDEKAETDNSLADDKEELSNTEKTLAEDENFLSKVNKKCDAEMAAYKTRQASRDEEILAINEAMNILGVESNATFKDDGRGVGLGTDNASDTSFLGFLQVSSTTRSHSKARSKAAQLLRSAARRSGDVDLSLLAASVHAGGLDMVIQEVDKMVAQLKLNQQGEVDEHDDCKEKLGNSAADISKLEQDLMDIEKATAKAKASVLEKEAKYTDAKQQIVSLQQALIKATLVRSNEKAAYEDTIHTTSFTLEFLIKALYRLARFYDKKNADALLLQVRRQAPPPPPKMKEYKAKKGNSIIQLLGKLINDAQNVLKEAAKDESDSVASFEELKADTEESTKLAQEAMTSLKSKKAALKKALNTLSQDYHSTDSSLMATKAFQKATADECRDLMNNFQETQQARQNEIEALQQTKQILRGASFD
mmetsp:Transcript_12264/g.23071  ORF Transcript_12264/g.23071 Transcript_12264/m.23071 type:complete len:771 (-) Transcript_12264:44-2356(-)